MHNKDEQTYPLNARSVLGRDIHGQAWTGLQADHVLGRELHELYRHLYLKLCVAAMSFENAGVSKGSFLDYFLFLFNETNQQNQGLIVTVALTSIFAGIFDIKHYFHLQVSETWGIIVL